MRGTGKLLLVCALALPVGLMATPAGATQGATCSGAVTTKTTAKPPSTTDALSGCTNAPATGGKGSLKATYTVTKTSALNIEVTITWNKTGVSGPFKLTIGKKPTVNHCKSETVKGKPVKDTPTISTGTITKGSGTGFKFLKNTKFSETVCVRQNDTTYLEPGTKVAI